MTAIIITEEGKLRALIQEEVSKAMPTKTNKNNPGTSIFIWTV